MAKLPIKEFVEFMYQQYKEGAGYIMGSVGNNPRTGYLDLSVKGCKSAWKVDGWYYSQYKSNSKQYKQALYWREHCNRVFDCQGLIEGFYEIKTGISVNTYARNNYATWCNPKGSGMIPVNRRVPGACVFWGNTSGSIHHVGYLYKPVVDNKPDGDWYIIEARGVMYGVVMTRLYERKPNFWGWATKYFTYDNSSITPSTPDTSYPMLRNGDENEYVKMLQNELIELGYDLGKWGADGDFGDCTEIAVKKFQKDNGLEVDGIVGPITWEYIAKMMAEKAKPVEDPKYVLIEGGNCYVRTLPNVTGEAIGVAMHDEKYPFAGEIDEETKWLKIKFKDKEGWVSCKYGRLVV